MKKNIENSKIFIISRTDSIGDVVLTLPLAGIIKKNIPDAKIIFIGNTYTFPVISLCSFIDIIVIKEDLMSQKKSISNFQADVILHVFPDIDICRLSYQANIPFRIGTSHRWFHWMYCNIKLNFSRTSSNKHESILNLKLLKPFISNIEAIKLMDIPNFYGISNVQKLGFSSKFKLILHPKSKGSAREWSMQYYCDLIKLLPPSNFDIFITGTEVEYQKIVKECPQIFDFENVSNMCGKFNLSSFITFIQQADAVLACSTGPLHIAAASGIHALGIYTSAPTMHPRRWAALGKNVTIFANEANCIGCNISENCACVNNILPKRIANFIETLKLN